jgi:hypothetical protein
MFIQDQEVGIAKSPMVRDARSSRGPSPGWRKFLKRHESSISACDFFCVQTILFQTLYVFFVIRHINREILHVAVTPFPAAKWVAQQVVECCAWDRLPPRFLIRNRDSRYGAAFDRLWRKNLSCSSAVSVV